jgi:hypothetical protein
MKGKMLFEMGNDGEPTWRKVEVLEKDQAFSFIFSEVMITPIIIQPLPMKEKKSTFQIQGAYLICKHPAWMVLNGKLYGFEKVVDGKKLLPFLSKNM